MNEGTSRQRSKRTKRIAIVAMMAVVGGLSIAATLPAFALTGPCVDATKCTVAPMPSAAPLPPGPRDYFMSGAGFSPAEALLEMKLRCASHRGTLTVTREYSESDEEGPIYYAEGSCRY